SLSKGLGYVLPAGLLPAPLGLTAASAAQGWGNLTRPDVEEFDWPTGALAARTDVKWMSELILGVPYSEIKALVYPTQPYKYFCISKRDGTLRLLAEPRIELKLIQKKILTYLEQFAGEMRPCVHGFVAGRSILTNASTHCSPKIHQILNLDLQDFFPSVSFVRVRGVLQNTPFNFSYEVATVLAHLCTLDQKLPQGAPTSPFLANLVCRTMDRDLVNLARQYRATYTRYADDITISFGVRNADRLPSALCSVVEGKVVIGPALRDLITTTHHFEINEKKTRLLDRYRRMEVTGIVVNEFPNVRRKFVDKIRGALNAWQKYGYEAAQKRWAQLVEDGVEQDYDKRPWKRQRRTGPSPDLKNVIWGKLLYLRMVRGKDDILYARLAERYNAVVREEKRQGDFFASTLPVEPVVREMRDLDDAVFVVQWDGDFEFVPGKTDMVGGQGTAFVFKEQNLLVTCDHVLESTANIEKAEFRTSYDADEVKNKKIWFTHSGNKEEAIPAKLLYRDKKHDVALLAFEDSDEIPYHKYLAAKASPIVTYEDGFLVGYPNYGAGNLVNVLKDIVLNRTSPAGISSFTVHNAGSIRPGNSGGPFLDANLRVAGVAQRGTFMGKGDDECLCVSVLESIVAKWKASQTAPRPSPEILASNTALP
ncbi:MAG TPA: reverse transcriptase domain-containing protein, partial [Burkholderiaceae bacterium]